MRRFSRIAILLMTAMAFLMLAAALAFAQETTTTVATEETVVTSDVEPAVPVTTADAAEPQLDWTYRYLIPTGIVLAVLVVVVTTIQYFTSVVRKRYRIVKE